MKWINYQSIDLCRFLNVKRDTPRKKEEQEKEYLSRFDFTCLFYDVFYGNSLSEIFFIGPPMYNFEKIFFWDDLRSSKGLKPIKINEFHRGKTFYVQVIFEHDVEELNIKIEDFELLVKPSTNHSNIFKSKNAIVTKQQNNELIWIKDWARYYILEHGIDSFLIYDNASTKYHIKDIYNALESAGASECVVLDWDFKFGPINREMGIFDSNFLEFNLLTHARLRFLRDSDSVLHCDIDELIQPLKGITLPEAVQKSKNGYIEITGEWVEAVSHKSEKEILSFSDFYHKHKSASIRQIPNYKWIISNIKDSPIKDCWAVHQAYGRENDKEYESAFKTQHFKGITSHRERRIAPDENNYFKDLDLQKNLISVYDKPQKI